MENAICPIIAKRLALSLEEIVRESLLIDLRADNLDTVEIMMELEDTYAPLRISDDFKPETIGQVVTHVRVHRTPPATAEQAPKSRAHLHNLF